MTACGEVDLSEIKPMIAMPFHPSNTYTIDELKANLDDILADVERESTGKPGWKSSVHIERQGS